MRLWLCCGRSWDLRLLVGCCVYIVMCGLVLLIVL